MVPAFGRDRPVLLPDHVDYAGPQKWLLWPTFRYRVVSPLVHEPLLNVFQEAVLGLARSGLRDVREIAALLSLEPELVALVVSDLKGYRYMNEHGAITDSGRAVLRDGFLDPAKNVVTHVYQDPFTGTLLPAETAVPKWTEAVWRDARRVRLNLRSAGMPLTKSAFVVAWEENDPVDPPGPEQIVEAVASGVKARRSGGRAAKRWNVPPPDRVISRVALIGSPDPTYVPFVIRLDKRGEDVVGNVSWSVVNAMTGAESNYLRRLVATRVQHWDPLRRYIEDFVGRRTDALFQDYDRLDIEIRRRLAETLEMRFTARVREHPALIEMLTLLERELPRTRLAGEHAAEVGAVVQRAWQVHEFILRGIVQSNPIDSAVLDRRGPLTSFLGDCCRRLGLPFSEQAVVGSVKASDLRRLASKPDRAMGPNLIALCLVSAAYGGPGHPFRRLAAKRPRLLTELKNVADDRNDSAHAELVVLNQEFAESAWQLTQHTVAAFLELPLTDPVVKESSVG